MKATVKLKACVILIGLANLALGCLGLLKGIRRRPAR